MSKRRGVTRGQKAANNHVTLIKDAIPLITAAKGFPEVTKVRNSLITGKGSRSPRLKIMHIPAGLKVVVCGSDAQQDVYIYSTDPAKTERELNAHWERDHSS